MMRIHLNGDGTTMLNDSIRYNINADLFKEQILIDALSDIEGIYKIEGLAFYSNKHGVKSPESLSNGMKALILCTCYGRNNYNELISNACMGANCGTYLQRLSLKYDFDIAWDYYLRLDMDAPIAAMDAKTGTVFNKGSEVVYFYAGEAGAV